MSGLTCDKCHTTHYNLPWTGIVDYFVYLIGAFRKCWVIDLPLDQKSNDL